MENNVEKSQDSGRGMFYAVIGVATLVITLIGATFAYLVATTNSDADAVSATGAVVTLGYCDVSTGINTNLIPIDPSLPGFNIGGFDSEDADTNNDYQFVGINDVDCKDINGNNICSVYQFTVTNTSSTSTQRVYATLVPKTNDFTNLKFALFKGTATDVINNADTHKVSKTVVADDTANINAYSQIELSDAQSIDAGAEVGDTVQVDEKIGWDVDGSAVTTTMNDFEIPGGQMNCVDEEGTNVSVAQSFSSTLNSTDAQRKHAIANRGDLVISETALTKSSTSAITLAPCEQVLDIGESMTYTIVLWVDETYSKQEDQGKTFTAQLKFTTEDTSGGQGTGVTGVLAVSS